MKPMAMTVGALNMPEAVTRRGPTRRAVSAPFRASIASLKKLVASWMATAPSSVLSASHRSKFPLSFHANTQPAQTGTTAAGRVFGRAARMQELRKLAGTPEVEACTLDFKPANPQALKFGPFERSAATFCPIQWTHRHFSFCTRTYPKKTDHSKSTRYDFEALGILSAQLLSIERKSADFRLLYLQEGYNEGIFRKIGIKPSQNRLNNNPTKPWHTNPKAA
jgi:hypothetical protein